ncbi:helix-hairpin-helix domain-containing protein [uncultured Muriicola sp.]|uniref:ComEA family DNA-binding protein n=1 Tax=uncultured Muriicola sp. TaxID=1583102 RepID=UPI002628D230|nr:helix-hairpin-helix domain-containing protein [uncultured Muriicola sp.]
MRSHLRYTKQEKRGIFFLLLLVAGLQSGYYFFTTQIIQDDSSQFSVDSIAIHYIDSVKRSQLIKKELVIRSFNPNFINDYKGYQLGVSPDELDSLYAFRERGNFVNSADEFQKVTGVSDSLLFQISPYFKFPQFTKRTAKRKVGYVSLEVVADLNLANEESLQRISGIGPVLSKRIIAFRNSLGGFLVTEQLLDVYGLEPEVASRAMKVFKVLSIPEIKKIPLNTASVEELASLVYINYRLAKQIVNYRNSIGRIDSIAQLTKIEDFPADRINRIKLYLSL